MTVTVISRFLTVYWKTTSLVCLFQLARREFPIQTYWKGEKYEVKHPLARFAILSATSVMLGPLLCPFIGVLPVGTLLSSYYDNVVRAAWWLEKH